MSLNPYAQATSAYGKTHEETDERGLEAKALLNAAMKVELIQQRLKQGENVPVVDLGEALEFNQKLWIFFVNESMSPEHPLPQEIKNNIASLGVFVFGRTQEVMINPAPEKMNILISINRNLASGLMKQVGGTPAPAQPHEKPAVDAKADHSV